MANSGQLQVFHCGLILRLTCVFSKGVNLHDVRIVGEKERKEEIVSLTTHSSSSSSLSFYH